MLAQLTDHILERIWSYPEQDYFSIFKPSKITRFNGNRLSINVHWDKIKLPDGEYYHAYQIGNIPTSTLGISYLPKDTWMSVSDLMNSNKAIVKLYSKNGITLPRYNSYLRQLNNGNLILIVPRFNGSVDLNTEDLYVKFYKSPRVTYSDKLEIVSKEITSISDISSLNAKAVSSTVPVYGFINGIFTTHVNANKVKIGDWVELVLDPTIKDIVHVPLNDLRIFTSEIDNTKRYLVYDHLKSDTIRYKDDVDFYLTYEHLPNQCLGRYINQNGLDDVRMVTHKDYSISLAKVNIISSYMEVEDVKLTMVIRDSYLSNKLPYENKRIHELYKLPAELIDNAMGGTLSNLDIWRAEKLESSGYVSLMQDKANDFTAYDVENALGYDAITRIVNKNPVVYDTDSVNKVFKLPQQVRDGGVVFEYVNGLLHDIVSFDGAQINYYPTDESVDLIEAYNYETGEFIGESNISDVDGHIEEVSLYKRPTLFGEPNGDWVEVSKHGDDVVISDDGKITWTLDNSIWETHVRRNNICLFNRLEIPRDKDYFKIHITGNIRTPDNIVIKEIDIPFDKLYLFLNGYSLVEGIDYHVKWPEVVIYNKKYLNLNEDIQIIDYLCTGNPLNGVRRPAKDKGFVFNGRLSNNNKFDLRDDKVVRVTVGGKLYDQNDVAYFEDDVDVPAINDNNGLPYSIDYPNFMLKGLSDKQDLLEFRKSSRLIDAQVSSFLNEYYLSPDPHEDNVIPTKYNVVSPVMNALISDYRDGTLVLPEGNVDYTLDMLESIIEPYKDLFSFDPCKQGYDKKHVSIHPHGDKDAILIHPKVHYFLHSVNETFLNGSVELHETLKIGIV